MDKRPQKPSEDTIKVEFIRFLPKSRQAYDAMHPEARLLFIDFLAYYADVKRVSIQQLVVQIEAQGQFKDFVELIELGHAAIVDVIEKKKELMEMIKRATH